MSRFGDGVLSVALPLLVLMATRSATDMGVVVAARLLPTVVFLLLGGAVTDRVSRRLAMVVSDVSRALIAVVLGILAVVGGLNFTELVVGSILFGLFDALFYPASTALLPDIVAPEHLAASNSLNRISGTLLGGLLGPLVGGVVASTIGVSWALIIDAGTFVASASCLLLMRPTARPVTTQTNVVREIIEGLSYCRKTPWLIWTITVAGVANALVFSPTAVMLPLLFKRVLHVSNFMVGVGFAALGLGGMLGGLVMLAIARPRARVRVMWLSWASAAGLGVAFGLSTSAWVASFVALGSGGLLTVGNILWDSLLQSEVPTEILGRVSSVDWTFSLGLSPIGVGIAGAVSGVVGIRATIVAPAIAVVIVAVGVLVGVRSLTAIDRTTAY